MASGGGSKSQSGAEDTRGTHSGRFMGKIKTMLTKLNPFSTAAQEIVGPLTLEEFREIYDRAIDELRHRCKRLDAADLLLSRLSTVTSFADELQSRNSRLTEKYNNAAKIVGEHNATLHRIGDRIEADMRKLDPSVLKNVSKSAPAPPEVLLDRLLGGYARNIEYISNLNHQMDQLEGDYKNLQLHLDDQKKNHQMQLGELQRTHDYDLELAQHRLKDQEKNHQIRSVELKQTHAYELELAQRHLNDQEKSHQIRLDELKQTHTNELELARKEREDAEQWHHQEVDKLKTNHADKIESLNSEFSSQRDSFNAENATLRNALTAGDRFQPMADQSTIPKFRNLRLLVSNLAKIPFRHEGINWERLEEFGRKEGLARWVPREGHNMVVENMIWGALVEGIFRNPFGVLGRVGEELSGMWSQLFRKGRYPNHPQRQSPALELPQPDDLSERWRHTTLEAFQLSLSSSTSPIKTSHASHLSALAATLTAILSSASVQDHASDIQRVVNTASSLALDFGIQRYRLEIFGADYNEEVEMGEMFGDSNNMTGTKGVRGRVLFVVSPGLRRVGEGRGGKWGQGKIIVPAMVYLKTDG